MIKKWVASVKKRTTCRPGLAEGARAHSFLSGVPAEMAASLREGMVSNCGCVALELDFSAGLTPTVRSAELLFGTTLAPH